MITTNGKAISQKGDGVRIHDAMPMPINAAAIIAIAATRFHNTRFEACI